MNKHEETAYTVSRSAIEKIARTAALGTEGVAKENGSSFSVRQKDGRITVQISIAAVYGSKLRELALAVQHHTAQAVQDMIDPDVMQIDVTIEDIVMPARA